MNGPMHSSIMISPTAVEMDNVLRIKTFVSSQRDCSPSVTTVGNAGLMGHVSVRLAGRLT